MVAVLIRVLVVMGALWFFALPMLKVLRRIFGRTLEGRIWLAREGIVEESPEAVLLFPWAKVNSFDMTELHGREAIRIWLNEDPDMQFRLLNLRIPASEKSSWMSDRIAALERSKYWTSAQLVLREHNVDEGVQRFFGQLRRLAEDPRAQERLPSVLDNPAPIDLDALGVVPTSEIGDDDGDEPASEA